MSSARGNTNYKFQNAGGAASARRKGLRHCWSLGARVKYFRVRNGDEGFHISALKDLGLRLQARVSERLDPPNPEYPRILLDSQRGSLLRTSGSRFGAYKATGLISSREPSGHSNPKFGPRNYPITTESPNSGGLARQERMSTHNVSCASVLRLAARGNSTSGALGTLGIHRGDCGSL